MFITSKLFAPLNYLRIKHSEKYWFDFILPVFFSIVILAATNALDTNINFLGDNGVIQLVNAILQILAGFYIASLAAVATFSRPEMDNVMQGIAPQLKGKPLTRRVFVTHLFGYLAFMSIFLYFLGGIAKMINLTTPLAHYLVLALEFIYLALLFNILFVTSLGLFYMIARIHRG
jgi:hypothetical protein|uniref:Uncharacterized protein n=1 Tax=Phage sp. ctHEp8 TaxID=2825790 RepID=A0A8S5TY30_9VIRU|nr:MAG TPA: hypothetical protein [Phage sp. ctHEp8]